MVHSRVFKIVFVIGFVLVIGLIFGCGPSVKQNAALDRARKAYTEAQANKDIPANAPVEMRDASKTLDQAEKAETDQETTRAANLSVRYVELATAKTEQKLAEAKAEKLAKESQQVLLESRQQEIEKAKKETEAKAKEAEKARKDAERLKKEADDKAREIERAKVEAEQLKKDAESKSKEAESAKIQAEKAKAEAEQSKTQAELAKAEAERAKAEAKKLEQELSELQAKQTDRGLVLTIGDVLFATGKSELMPGAMRSIDKLSAFLNKFPKRNVFIEGHTDSRGSEELNLSLSERRAESVQMALTARGIDGRRITTKGYGKSYPIASNDTEAGRQQNRRVEIVILEEGKTVESIFRK